MKAVFTFYFKVRSAAMEGLAAIAAAVHPSSTPLTGGSHRGNWFKSIELGVECNDHTGPYPGVTQLGDGVRESNTTLLHVTTATTGAGEHL